MAGFRTGISFSGKAHFTCALKACALDYERFLPIFNLVSMETRLGGASQAGSAEWD
jgi:hypothetical protein